MIDLIKRLERLNYKKQKKTPARMQVINRVRSSVIVQQQ